MKFFRNSFLSILSIFLLLGISACGTKQLMNNTSSSQKKQSSSISSKISKSQNSTVENQNLSSFQMVNSSIGWAISHGSIYFTKDDAQTWEKLNPKGLKKLAKSKLTLFALDSTHVWVVQSNFNKAPVSIFQTINGGEAWNETKINDTGSALSLKFSDKNHGWFILEQGVAMGSSEATIYQTNDGGQTWKRASYTNNRENGTLPFGGDKTGASFINDFQNGWLTGQEPVGGTIYLYHTNDAGRTWKQQNVYIPSKLKGYWFTSYPPVFFNKNSGVLLVSFSGNALIYQTDDGGHSWKPTIPLLYSDKKRPRFKTWDCISKKRCIVVSGQHLSITNDGGKSWKNIKANFSLKGIKKLDFVTLEKGWILMNSGKLYRTTDGGMHWTK